jgi:hypothetical protein
MTATLANNKSNESIFNFGSILDRITKIGGDTIEKVAPVWLEQQLDINQRMPVAQSPTFQNTDPQRQPGAGLTTNEGSLNQQQTSPVFQVSQGTLLLGGFAALGTLLFLRDNG